MAKHSKKGRKKYRCGECNAESFHHWIELNRAAGVKCTACGSRRMELVTKEAREEAADKQTVRVLGGTPSTTFPREDSNKKVT